MMTLKEAIKYVCEKFNDVDYNEVEDRVKEILESDMNLEDSIYNESDLDLINPEGMLVNMLVAFIPVKDELRT